MTTIACTPMAAFSRDEAKEARKAIARRVGLFAVVYHCGECDLYHLAADEAKQKSGGWGGRGIDAEHYRILNLIAHGYTRAEIAREVGANLKHVEYVVRSLSRRLYALNAAHLIAIASALGLLNPREFVPGITERKHK